MLAMNLHAQEELPLYDKEVPNSIAGNNDERAETGSDGILRIYNVSKPTLTVYLPDAGKSNGTAVIICPGGGYRLLAAGHEGADVAREFTKLGVTAFVLKYRLPDEAIMKDKSIAPLQDAQRAIQMVREKAKIWQLNPKQIGIMGFSAGGHLAASAGVHFDNAEIDNPLKTSLRPDFMILVYPVISFTDELAHKGSREQLLGKTPDKKQVVFFSAEQQVSKKTPPTFLVHAKDDKAVKYENSMAFAASLEQNKVKHDIYLYDKGGHGFGMVNKTSDVKWMKYVQQWMADQDLLIRSTKF